MKILKNALYTALIAFALLLIVVYFSTFHPKAVEEAEVICESNPPTLQKAKELKIFSWNVQYFAGKEKVFWYDVPDESGPDTAPTSEEIQSTLKKVANVILEKSPDIILLQEVDDGARRTHGENQSERLLPLLSDLYPCRAETFYWKAGFVPHPKILGSVGMKLVTLSKYKIGAALRHQLPLTELDPISNQFRLKRAVLQVDLPIAGGGRFVALNTHLDAFSMGTDTMQKQVNFLAGLLSRLDEEKADWILAGDFNLLPPEFKRSSLHPNGAFYYSDDEEIKPLFDRWSPAATVEELNGPDREKFFTYYPNDPLIAKPDRTIDYIFFSKGLVKIFYSVIRSGDAAEASDHFPLEAVFRFIE
ncbi:endonuclease/exonuclease/phosphatase family protein [Leptospira fainei serovar Hurstbridge str. BUT 6]|uniref:Endonuclease/exonuclease/phosphatase family protein n=1 Tax=Leptospira fainei serovar Hurstbridge str. BUT 6 TaxID=1193011 RepID=S3UXE3_9LEPT|nr:endonuclease/exonuclease/phosphatase family protein [Leptospira fainei]EPG75031.1 endonuclease/exonuclease/phosphatase family protein [Leptospira fainei serovar Hurstbridge str. BUT 6]